MSVFRYSKSMIYFSGCRHLGISFKTSTPGILKATFSLAWITTGILIYPSITEYWWTDKDIGNVPFGLDAHVQHSSRDFTTDFPWNWCLIHILKWFASQPRRLPCWGEHNNVYQWGSSWPAFQFHFLFQVMIQISFHAFIMLGLTI